MADDKTIQAEERAVEPETTQTDSPTVKETQLESQTNQDEAISDGVSDDIPEDIEKQRKAFQEMRQEIKRLKEEKTVREKSESVFDQFKPQAQTPDVSQFADPITGNVDWNAYQQADSQRVRAEAQQAARDEVDEYRAREKHPELFNDPEVEKEIAAQWFFEKYQGQRTSITEIADRVAKRYSKAVTKAEKIGADKALDEVSEKEKAAMEATSQTSEPARQATASADLDSLREQSRFGDEDAIAARLKSIPWANK